MKTPQTASIAFYLDSMDPGGSERNAIRLLDGLPALGYRVAVIANAKSGILFEQLNSPESEMAHIPISPSIWGKLGFIFNAAWFLRKGHFDIAQGYNDISILYLALAAKLAGTPMLVFGLRNTHIFNDKSLKTRLVNWVCSNLVRGIIVNSNQTFQQMVQTFKVADEKVKIVYNGVQTKPDRQPDSALCMRRKLGIPSEKKTVGIVARMEPVKKIGDFIEAARELIDLPWQFVLVGDGSQKIRMEEQVAGSGLSDRFVFAGVQKDPFPWMAALDIGVLCSESEGFPQAILEYMAVGLPVVATSVGGVPDLVMDGQTGFLVPPNDPASLAMALRRLMENDELRGIMGRTGQKRAREAFSLEKEVVGHSSAYLSWLKVL